jgi:peptidoglycan/LPS O-acetylase OafA/YrhL
LQLPAVGKELRKRATTANLTPRTTNQMGKCRSKCPFGIAKPYKPLLGIQSKSRISELDGVRGLAILTVVLFHFLHPFVLGTSAFVVLIREVISLGWTGVDLFFVLSGFLIGGILIDHRRSEHYFKTFYVRRVCRIVPIYFFGVGLFFVLGWLLSSKASTQWYSKTFVPLPHCPGWSYFVFLQNFWIARMGTTAPHWTGITWSLCVEEQFYLLMPLTIWLVSPRKLPTVLAVLIFLTFLCRSFFCIYFPSYFPYVSTPCRLDTLLIGVLCACLIRDPRFESLIRRRYDWLYLIFALLFCGMAYFVFSPARGDYNSFDLCTWGYTWIALFYASFLLIVITDKTGPFARIMRNSLLRHFAVISYCVYLINLQINDSVHDLLFQSGFMVENIFSNALAILLELFIT